MGIINKIQQSVLRSRHYYYNSKFNKFKNVLENHVIRKYLILDFNFQSTGPKVRYTPSRIGRLSVCSLCNMNISGNSTLPSSSLATLRLHLESNHAPETGFICKVCSVPNSAQYHVFIDLAAALEHLQVRHGQVDFSDRSVLKRMFDFPDDPRSFKCLKCSQVFLGQDFHTGGILKHLKNAHGSDPQCLKPMGPRGEDRRLADLKIVVLNCRKCGGNFNSEETLIEHAFSCMTEIWWRINWR